jgi:hypothetical protein
MAMGILSRDHLIAVLCCVHLTLYYLLTFIFTETFELRFQENLNDYVKCQEMAGQVSCH